MVEIIPVKLPCRGFFEVLKLENYPTTIKVQILKLLLIINQTLTQQDIGSHPLDIRVYNTDFVNENLSFLTDSIEGEVKPFAIIGSENREIEEQIKVIENELGDEERKTGLKHELNQKKEDYDQKKDLAENAEKALDKKLGQHANNVIKHSKTYGNPNYNIRSYKGGYQNRSGKIDNYS